MADWARLGSLTNSLDMHHALATLPLAVHRKEQMKNDALAWATC